MGVCVCCVCVCVYVWGGVHAIAYIQRLDPALPAAAYHPHACAIVKLPTLHTAPQGFDPSHGPFLHDGIAGMRQGDSRPMDGDPLPPSKIDLAKGFTWHHGAYMVRRRAQRRACRAAEGFRLGRARVARGSDAVSREARRHHKPRAENCSRASTRA